MSPLCFLAACGSRRERVWIFRRACLRGWGVWVGARNDPFTRFDEGLVSTSVDVDSRRSTSYLPCPSLDPGQVVDDHREVFFRDLKGWELVGMTSWILHSHRSGPDVADYPVLTGFVEFPSFGRGGMGVDVGQSCDNRTGCRYLGLGGGGKEMQTFL